MSQIKPEQAETMDSGWTADRGEKQALISTPIQTIWKYQIPVLEKFSLTLPENSKVLRVANEGGKLWMWINVHPHADVKEYKFLAFKTGADMGALRNAEYIGCAPIFIQAELMLYYFRDMS